jgi:hypothetical protein
MDPAAPTPTFRFRDIVLTAAGPGPPPHPTPGRPALLVFHPASLLLGPPPPTPHWTGSAWIDDPCPVPGGLTRVSVRPRCDSFEVLLPGPPASPGRAPFHLPATSASWFDPSPPHARLELHAP